MSRLVTYLGLRIKPHQKYFLTLDFLNIDTIHWLFLLKLAGVMSSVTCS